MDCRKHLSVTWDFLLRSVSWFCLLADQFFQSLICCINTLNTVRSTCALNQSDFKKGFQFINISFQKKLLLTFVLMNFSDHLHNFRSKQLFWLFYIIKSSHVIYLISELSTSFYSKMMEISMGWGRQIFQSLCLK